MLHTILWIWILSTIRDMIHKIHPSHRTLFEISFLYSLFSSLSWLWVGNTDATGRAVPCQRTLIKKKKADYTTFFTLFFRLFQLLNYFLSARIRQHDHANANSTFETWWLSHFQQIQHDAWTYTCFLWYVWRDLMGYEDGKRTDWFTWMKYEVMLLLSRCCCMQVSQRASDLDFLTLLPLSLQHWLEALWLILDSFHLTFLHWPFFFFFFPFCLSLIWLDCSALSIAFFRSYLSMHLIEFTSELYFQPKHWYLFFSPYTVFCCFTLPI